MKPLYKILASVCFTCLSVFIISKICFKGHRYFYKPFYDKLDTAFYGNQNYNVILLGNSKVQFGMNPQIIDSTVKCNSYNMGYAAANFLTQHIILDAYLKAHPAPKVLVWCVQQSMFNSDEEITNKYMFFNYLQSPIIKQFSKKLNIPYTLVKTLPATKFIFFDDYNKTNIISGLRNKSEYFGVDKINYKGFSISKNNNTAIKFNKFPDVIADTLCTESTQHFFSILDLCKTNNIKILFIWPPTAAIKSKNFSNNLNPFIFGLVDSICKTNNYQLVRYDSTTEFKQSEFLDDSHVNYQGSNHYSLNIGYLIDSLKLLK